MNSSIRQQRFSLTPLAILIFVIAGLAGAPPADARDRAYTEQSVRGTWIWSGLLKFGAPIPVPATVVDGAPPHGMVSPGGVVGVWASTVGRMQFDGRGNVVHARQVVRAGEIELPPGLPFESLPLFEELYTGTYTVDDTGAVQIALRGRDGMSDEGDVDFEYDLHCLLNRWPLELTCVPARFKTFLVDTSGYPAPITGTIGMKRQH